MRSIKAEARSVPGGTAAAIAGRLLGLNVLGKLDLGETEGFVTTLASPSLTALSGEKATFLAGGEIPIAYTITSNGGNTQTVVYKPYGITVDFYPTVLSDGRISLSVKPEVSEIDPTITVQGYPGFKTRRVDTTVELGSGQSFVIGGLMKADNSNNMTKLPGAGDVPILGALFRSNAFKRGETELMIVVTPYLVKPVPASQIVLPTDGYKTPTELGRIFGGDLYKGASERRPTPTTAPAQTIARPAFGAALTPQQAQKAAVGAPATPRVQQVIEGASVMRKLSLLPATALLLTLGACGGTTNRGLESVHQAVVSRTDYVFDMSNAYGPASSERLAAWFDSLNVHYGDRIAVDDPSGSTGNHAAVAAVAGRYGLLLQDAAPVTQGAIPPGSFRVRRQPVARRGPRMSGLEPELTRQL